MPVTKTLIIDGQSLTIDAIVNFIKNPHFQAKLSSSALAKAKKSAEFLKKEASKRIIYGINTGFGPMAYKIMGKQQMLELQMNLVRSHAVGIGQAVDPNFVLATMLVRLNTLAKGYSGVSLELLKRLELFINQRVIPVVPEHGAVGTSGDLVQLAHIALALLGQGQVMFRGKQQDAAKVLAVLRLKPYQLKVKEGLALINGTSFMTGVGALLCKESEQLLELAHATTAMSLEAVGSFNDGISEIIQDIRPHPGQIQSAAKLRRLLKNSRRLKNRSQCEHVLELNGEVQSLAHEVQEVYSLRCAPQILGPMIETIRNARKVLEIEINSVTDNPIIDLKNKTFPHGGNFHGDYIASTLDKLKAAMVKLTMLSERRINFFYHDKKNQLFPPFLNLKQPGLNLGLQGLQFVATSTAAQSQSLAYPHHLHSIPTNGENQDVVSMGADAALLAHKVIDNAYVVLAIELVTVCQAMDFTGERDSYAPASQDWYGKVRAKFPTLYEDRYMAEQLQQLKLSLPIVPNFYNLL